MNQHLHIKVLHVIRQGLIGGGESHVLTLADKLDKNAVTSYVLSFTDGPMVDKLKSMGIQVAVIPVKHPLDWRLYVHVRKLINEWGVQLIHAHGSRACAFMVLLAVLKRIKIVYTIHGWSFHPDQAFWVKFFRKTWERIITQLTDINICVSDSNLQTGKALYAGFKAKVIRYGIDLKKFSSSPEFYDYRKEWDVPSDAKLVLYAARMTIQKQPLVALEAFEHVATQHPDIYLVMAGGGELLEEVKYKIMTLSCRDRIRLKPFYTDMPGILQASDIFILPSLWEGLPIALLEAMAMGKVVLASAVDGTKELIVHRKNGILLNVSDGLAKDMGESIAELVSDDLLFNDLSSQARKTIELIYNSSMMAGYIKDVYKECLNS